MEIMSRKIINYSLQDGTAFDEDGDGVKVEFVIEHGGENLFGPYVTVDGVLCKANDLELWTVLLSFWATPMSLSDCLEDMRQRDLVEQIEVERLLQQEVNHGAG
jgi:hypothetical protein